MCDYSFTWDQMVHLLEYVVHKPDCPCVTHRDSTSAPCSCGLSQAMTPVRDGDRQQPRDRRLALNCVVFGGKFRPRWLCDLIPIQHRPVSHRNPYQPGHMSDG